MTSRAKILDTLEAAGHGAHRAQLDALITPAIFIKGTRLAGRPRQDPDAIAAMDAAMAKLPLGASRFGGLPDLPPDVTWPDRDGVPMEFVAQIKLDELPPLEDGLPASGTLWFFYNSQWQTSDWAPGEPVCAVIYSERTDLVRTPAPSVMYKSEYMDEPYPAPWVHGLASLAFSTYDAVPGGVSPYVTGGLQEIWQDFHSEHWAAISPGTGDGTYDANALLGYVDAQDYVDAHQHGTEDRLLLKVDSDDAAEFQWGDCDALFFLIPRAALRARDFSQVRLYSQLG